MIRDKDRLKAIPSKKEEKKFKYSLRTDQRQELFDISNIKSC